MKKKLSAVFLALAASMPMTAQNLVKGNYGYLYCHMSDKGGGTAYAISRVWHLRSFKTFTKLTTPKLLFDWGYATIDADINFLKSDGLYHMLIKKEGGKSGKNY